MEWLINLLFSNLWIVILVYAVVKGIFRSTPVQRRRRVQPHQIPSTRPNDPAQVNIGKSEASQEWKKTEVSNTIETSENERPLASIETKREQGETKTTDVLPVPVQGMMWSEIFGPPVSKKSRR